MNSTLCTICMRKGSQGLKNKNLNHIEIAKKTREYFTEDRFLETIFK